MLTIGELFETRIEDKIEPVIKVGEVADERKLAAEIGAYVVTPTIERYLASFLDHYTDTFQLRTTEIGIWISGYFGSGKSHLAKIMSLLAENRRLAGTTACERFKARIPDDAPERGTIHRALARMPQADTRVLAFNINTLTDSKTTPLPKVLLSQYYQARGYGSNLLYARVIEAELDRQGKLAALHQSVESRSKKSWAEIQKNPTFYQKHLYDAAHELAPDHFASPAAVGDALQKAAVGELHNVGFLVDTLLDDLAERERQTRRTQRLMLVLDESGQWIEGDASRLSQLQALIEEAAIKGQGRIWIVVTTHADMGSILKEAKAIEGDMKKIEGRFRSKFSLTTENIELVLEDRLFKKTVAARRELGGLFAQRGGVLRDLGELKHCDQALPDCGEDRFITYYPFFPYQVHLIPEIVKSLRSKGGKGEQLSGSTRTLLAITQDILRAGRRRYLDAGVGPLVSFDEVYGNLSGEGEISPDVRDELARLARVVPDATPLTQHVAEILYLVRELPYLHRSRENIARLAVQSVDDDVATLTRRIEPELERLKKARLVAQVGDEYEFLTGEKRTFEEEVSNREAELRVQDRERGFSEHFCHSSGKAHWFDWLSLQSIPYGGAEFDFKLYVDILAVPGRRGDITLRVTSPLGRETVQSLEDRSLRSDEQNTLFVWMPPNQRIEQHLSRYLAMREVIDAWKGDSHRSEDSRRLASEREAEDLRAIRGRVLEGLRDALARGVIVFRGASRSLSVPQGKKAGDALRAELATYWPVLYPKYDRVPVRVANEEQAIKEVLSGGTTGRDAVALKLFDKAGKLDPNSPLLDALRVYLAGQQARAVRVLGADLLREFTGPPYGWDGNAVRVGLAALVRAAAVKVILNKKPYTNPADPELVDALRVSRNFDKAELVLEETEVDPDVLAETRAWLRRVSKRRDIDETPAAISEVAGQLAAELADRVSRVRLWASGASFPLPRSFADAAETWEKISALTNPVHRTGELHRAQAALEAGKSEIERHATFQASDGAHFVNMAALARTAAAVLDHTPEGSPLRTFTEAFQAASTSACFSDREVWRQTRSLEATARMELSAALEGWREAARRLATGALQDLPDRLADLGLDAATGERLGTPLKRLLEGLDEIQAPIAVAGLEDRAARLIRELDAALKLEASRRKKPDEPTPPRPPDRPEPPRPPKSRERRRVRVGDVVPDAVVHDLAGWDTVREKLDARVRALLADGYDVEIG